MNHMHLSHAFTPQSVVANLTIPQTVWLQGFLQLCSKTLGEPFLGSGHWENPSLPSSDFYRCLQAHLGSLFSLAVSFFLVFGSSPRVRWDFECAAGLSPPPPTDTEIVSLRIQVGALQLKLFLFQSVFVALWSSANMLLIWFNRLKSSKYQKLEFRD